MVVTVIVVKKILLNAVVDFVQNLNVVVAIQIDVVVDYVLDLNVVVAIQIDAVVVYVLNLKGVAVVLVLFLFLVKDYVIAHYAKGFLIVLKY